MKKLTILLAIYLAGCSNVQNDRVDYVFSGTGTEIRCPAPPADIVETLKKGGLGFDLKLKEIQKVALNSNIEVERKYEKIREIDPRLQTVETIHYRLCVEYANKTFTKEEYKEVIRGLLLNNMGSQSKSANSGAAIKYIELPKRVPIAPAGTWADEPLGLVVKVSGIGGFCLAPCTPTTKAYMEIKTSSFIFPNYEGEEGFAIPFTHDNKTYKLMIEEVKEKPAYVVISVEEITT